MSNHFKMLLNAESTSEREVLENWIQKRINEQTFAFNDYMHSKQNLIPLSAFGASPRAQLFEMSFFEIVIIAPGKLFRGKCSERRISSSLDSLKAFYHHTFVMSDAITPHTNLPFNYISPPHPEMFHAISMPRVCAFIHQTLISLERALASFDKKL